MKYIIQEYLNKKKHRECQVNIIVISGIMTFLILMFLFWVKGLAPFGAKSLVVADADIQYLEFFAYYKAVLAGENSIGYSLGKVLGGSSIAIFSYYLSSPFNPLIIFFEYSELCSFYDIIVALKLSLAAVTFSYFCINRFGGKDRNVSIFIITAIGYGLCQYNISQSRNIMWLDGVYMLPLVLLQVSNLVRKKSARSLPLLVGLAIVFNWYSAGIDCLFSAFWFFFEFILYSIEEKTSVKWFFQCAFRYVTSMIWGVLLSAVLFLPTVGALKKGSRGSLHFEDLKDLSFLGEIPTVIQKYTYGSASDTGSVALFCGSIAIVLALFTIFCHEIRMLKRMVYAGFFLGTIMIFYWHPLFLVFSLFQWVGSYHYRYSYVGVFSILFLAVVGGREFNKRQQAKQLFAIAVAFSALQIILFYCKPVNELKYVYATATVIVIETMLFMVLRFAEFKSIQYEKGVLFGFIALGIFDLAINTNCLIDRFSKDNVTQYQTYRKAQEELISEIKSEDSSAYRISQTTTRNMKDNGLTANYNEGLSYNYASISGYSSSPDDIQREFLNRLGYRICGENMCITNTSILGADSLLGVKYVLSPYEIQGLIKLYNRNKDEKTVYQNPYSFPFAFTYTDTDSDIKDATNPFEYQNSLYSKIFGLSEELYTRINHNIIQDESGCGAIIQLEIPETSNVAVYGSIPWNYEADSSIYVNGRYLTKYASWLSPSVFYIPQVKGQNCDVEVRSDSDNFSWNEAQFYALNLDVLKRCAEIANANKAEQESMGNGSVYVRANKRGERLFLSIPADEGWTITINGKTADSELIGDCLYSIKLTDDINNITMKYHVQYLRAGIIISLIALLTYCIYLLLYSKECLNNNKMRITT